MATTGKIAEVLFEKAIETYEHQMNLLPTVAVFKPNSADMQNAGNVVWRPVQQHAPVIEGWDLTGQETDIIEETYPAILGLPKNDLVQQRADDLRDMQFWERRGEQSGLKQATELNKAIATTVANTGAMAYIYSHAANAASGFNFVAGAQALMNEREIPKERCFVLNDRDNLEMGKDLAGRQTLQGRPENTWATGQIGQNIADFDIYTASVIPVLAYNAGTATTTTAAVSQKPEGGTVNTGTGVVTNVDYRLGVIPVNATGGGSGNYEIGEKITMGVNALGLASKTDTGQLMTFTVVGKPDTTTLQVYPKPIALDDGTLSTIEKAYANIKAQIANGATVTKLGAASERPSIYYQKDSIEVTSGDAPIQLLNEFGGMKVISSAMSNGQKMYMAYDGNIDTLNFKFRLFTWYAITNANPSANGVAIRRQT